MPPPVFPSLLIRISYLEYSKEQSDKTIKGCNMPIRLG
uniref:Uncharacterized protein n=1 Tax=uncultured Desulfobacterium sp. TaxID=201089 RepID=E1YDE5_9BACT|nr:unknown protein [uncultured Desulfobacterium sp.]